MRKGRDSLAVVRCLALVTLVVGMVVGAAFDAPLTVHGVAVAKGKSNGNHGGHGQGKKDDKKEKPKGKGKGNKGQGRKGGGAPEPVEVVVVQPEAGYRVTVGCHADTEHGQSTCVFAGVATAEGETVGGLAVPEGAVCASVVDGDFVRSDGGTARKSNADWYAVGSGYRGPAFVSSAQPDVLTVVLAAEVTTGGTATYWLRTADGVAAVAGPGLRCAPASATATTTTAAAAQTGAVIVQGFDCPFTSAPTTAKVDWFSTCDRPAVGAVFELTALDGDNAGWHRSETVDATGVLRADDLVPGHYRLVQVGGDWCHAESDRVDDRGEVIVNSGERSSVWIFDCGQTADATPTPT
jgi:hypothetical protein